MPAATSAAPPPPRRPCSGALRRGRAAIAPGALGTPKPRRGEGGSVKILVRRDLAERAVRLLHQIRLDELVDVAVEHAIHVADRFLRPVILGELVRMQHVAADLAAEADRLLRAA